MGTRATGGVTYTFIRVGRAWELCVKKASTHVGSQWFAMAHIRLRRVRLGAASVAGEDLKVGGLGEWVLGAALFWHPSCLPRPPTCSSTASPKTLHADDVIPPPPPLTASHTRRSKPRGRPRPPCGGRGSRTGECGKV